MLAAAALAAPAATRAQSKTAVVGLLWNDSVKPSPNAVTLLAALRQLGWATGRNLEVRDHVTLEGYAPIAEGAAALVRERCDVIVTYGTTATSAAAKATSTIPIAMLIGVDPVKLGVAASLSRPGGNVTGLTNLSHGLIGKRLELLREVSPGLSSVGVLTASGSASEGRLQAVRETETAAAALKLKLHFAQIYTPEDIEAGAADLAKAGVRAVYVAQGTFLVAQSERIVRALAEHRLIAVYAADRFVEDGGLMAYAQGARKSFTRLAWYVDRLLKGGNPADMPIEQLTDVELVINLKTAQTLGVKMPQSVLQRADRAIQ